MEGMYRWAVYVRDWNPSEKEWEIINSVLSSEERKKVASFKFKKDQKLALCSRLLQRKLIHTVFNIPYESIEVPRTEENKPYWIDSQSRFPNWNFNVSHHGGVVAIASEPICLVGVDVMDWNERHSYVTSADEFFKSFEGNFTPLEWKNIRNPGIQINTSISKEDAKYRQFYRHWQMKEAYIKAIGIGLGFPLQRAEFHYVEDRYDNIACVYIDGIKQNLWSFESSELIHQHGVTVARGDPSDACSNYQRVLNGSSLSENVVTSGLRLPSVNWEILKIENILPEFIQEEYRNIKNQ